MNTLKTMLAFIAVICMVGTSLAVYAGQNEKALSPPPISRAVITRLYSTATDERLSRILMKMESPTEDMLDEIDSRNTQKLNQLYNKLKTDMVELNQHNAASNNVGTQAKNIAMLNAWFDLISVEMKEMDDFPALAYVTNQFTAQLIITTEYKQSYEKNIAWMDYLGRELLLLSKYPDLNSSKSLINARKKGLKKTWRSLTILISKTGKGIVLIKRANPIINGIMQQSQHGKLIELSKLELDLVDNIETYFHIN